MFNKIIVGIDGSKPSEKALRLACDLATKYGSELCLIHTPQPKTVAFALGAMSYHTVTTMPSPEKVNEAAAEIINSGIAIAKSLGHTITKTHTNRGNPADEIIAYTKECGADLIVTGRRGLGNIGSLVQGSTTGRIGQLAECACLSVV